MQSSLVDAGLRRRLDAAGVPYCVIGAAALAVHGYARASDDIDLLTLDARALDPAFWEGAEVKIRKGDFDDPLQGSVLWEGPIQHDIVVGRGYAARHALEAAVHQPRLGCRVASPLSLVLLKLEAGGAQDLYDVLALMARRKIIDRAPWIEQIPAELPHLSARAREAWERLQRLQFP